MIEVIGAGKIAQKERGKGKEQILQNTNILGAVRQGKLTEKQR